MRRLECLVVIAGLALAACKKPVPPAPPADDLDSVARYAVDDPEGLRRYCLTEELDGCSAVESLAEAEAALRALHAEQLEAQREALADVLEVLEAEDETPVMRITAIPLEPDTWSSKDQEVPATLEVRSELERGFDAMPEGTLADFRAKLSKLKKMYEAHDDAFKALEDRAPKSFALPADLAKERAPASITAAVVEGTATVKVLSAALEDQEFERPEPWVAVVSFVITAEGLPYRAIDDHRLPLPAPVVVSLSDAAISITERQPKAGKTDVSSTLPVDAVCDTLRGEVRYTRADEPLRLQASFVPVPSTDGGE